MEKNLIYDTAFMQSFGINESQLINLKYQDIDEWDSVGHMGLITSIEEAFNIEMDIDDIIDFSSYDKGKEILVKYNISLNA